MTSEEAETTSASVRPVLPRAPEPDTCGDDPFAQDDLERREVAYMLTAYASRVQGPHVLAIDAPWGCGKTTFIRMWEAHLRNEGFECISFNAWSADFVDDPFVALVGEISQKLEVIRGETPIDPAPVVSALKSAAVGVAKRALPAVLKHATSGILDVAAMQEDAASALAEIAESIAEETIASYSADKNSLQLFRQAVLDAVKALRERDRDGSRPLIFFIDELDRCRPTFALSLLERAKHLFDVEGIVFVLAVDRSQLAECARAVYGSGIDAQNYLRRFIDTDFTLPTPERGRLIGTAWNRIGLSDVLKRYANDPKYEPYRREQATSQLFRLVCKLADVTNLSARTALQCVARLGVVARTIPTGHRLYPTQLALLAVMREWRSDLYQNYLADPADYDPVLRALESNPSGAQFFQTRDGGWIEAAMICGVAEARDNWQLVSEYQERANRSKAADEQRGETREQEVASCLDVLVNMHEAEGMAITFDRIELTGGFFEREYD